MDTVLISTRIASLMKTIVHPENVTGNDLITLGIESDPLIRERRIPMNIKARVLGAGLALALTASMAGCGGTTNEAPSSDPGDTVTNAESTSPDANELPSTPVYFLNFKPEVAEIYKEIVKEYKAETGVDVKVDTAASGTYEQTLSSEIAKSAPPTIFQINGPVGYGNWKDYIADVRDSDLYKHLSDPSLAISSADGAVWGIPYVVEGYGIIYNNDIMKKYFAMSNKAVSISSVEEINSFALLKQVAEDMTAKKDALGIKGVFSSTSLKPGDEWRWGTHLANVPFYYEFKTDGVDLSQGTPKEVKFSYGANYQNIFDLYLNNSVTAKTQLGAKTVDESMAEFALGQSAMVQNGNWGWGQVSGVQGNIVKAEDIGFLPIYIGAPGEEKQGICIGTENYFAINSKVSKETQKASLDFLNWLFTSEKGKAFVINDLGFFAPFDSFSADERPTDPLAQDLMKWMTKDGVETVSWSAFQVFPSQDWKSAFGKDLLSYAQGKMDWASVSSDVVSEWKTQVEMADQ